MRIGEMARRAGVSPKAVRRYEQLGLLTPHRMPNGYRDFTEQDVRIARELRSLRDLGIKAERTRPFLDRLASGAAESDECPASPADYSTVIDELTARITALTDRRAMLPDRLTEAAYRNSVAAPPRSPALSERTAPPDDTAGTRREFTDSLGHRALDRLVGRRLPGLALPATDGETPRIDRLGNGRTVLYLYPLAGRPGRDLPEGWKTIPGAAGCTQEACGFRDHHRDLLDAGAAKVYGLSSQDTDYQRELVDRLRLPFAMLSDQGFAFASALGLPTFHAARTRLHRRLTLIVRDTTIEHVFHPIPDPESHAAEVIRRLRGH